MRLRRKPGTREKLMNEFEEYVVNEPGKLRGRWRDVLDREEIQVEFGSGKGRFITTKAVNEPDTGFIGVEKEPEVLLKTAKKAEEGQPENLKLLYFDVAGAEAVFAQGELDRIYLNFSDPWPKRRHSKRRLTHRDFLAMYGRLLAPGGEIHFKTDNRGLFEFSLNEFCAAGWDMKNIRLDYGLMEAPGDVPTEYEERFRSLGQSIYRLEAWLRQA